MLKFFHFTHLCFVILLQLLQVLLSLLDRVLQLLCLLLERLFLALRDVDIRLLLVDLLLPRRKFLLLGFDLVVEGLSPV